MKSHCPEPTDARRIGTAIVGVLLLSVAGACGTGHNDRARAASTATTTNRPSASTVSPADHTTSTAPVTTTPGPAPTTSGAEAGGMDQCEAIDGETAIPGGTALVRSPATDHARSAVVMLHGYTATTRGEETVSGWTDFLAGTDSALIYPQGNPTATEGFGWTTGTDRFSTSGTDDVGRLASMLGWLIEQNCVDPTQVLIAGESNGAAMALTLACSGRLPVEPRLFALAIPAVDEHVTARCDGARPFPALAFAGRLDATVPYGGTPGDAAEPDAPLEWFSALMPGLQGCAQAQQADSTVPGGTVTTWPGCTATTVFFTIDQGRHTWPGGPVGAAGLDPGTFPAAALAWCASGLTAQPPPVDDCLSLLTRYRLPANADVHPG